MPDVRQIDGKLLARNTGLNLLGQGLPLLVGLATIPYVVHGLGTERFGILSIAWVLLGYFSLFDLGLGRATTKFVAECLGEGEMYRLAVLVWTSAGIQMLFGAAGAVIAAAATFFLVEKLLKIPVYLIHDAKLTFILLAGSLPVVLLTNCLRGVLEAAQRFDLVNYLKVPVSVSVFLLPAIAIPFGIGLPGIALLLILARFGAAVGYLVLCLKVFPVLRRTFSFRYGLLRPLATYGGWVTVSNLVSPLFSYIDRFFIGALLSMAAVTFFTAPFEAITRAGLVLPLSLVATLFPAFSTLDASAARERMEFFFVRSLKLILLVQGPVLLLVVVFAPLILRLWLGADFAANSTLTLQLLAVGVGINSLAHIPYNLLQGLGRPDVTAKFHLTELPIYTGFLWFLTGRMGISGAALAWSLRVGLDALLLFGACRWLRLVSVRALLDRGLLRSIMVLGVFALALSLTWLAKMSLVAQAVLVVSLVSLFSLSTWSFALDNADRSFLVSAAGRVIPFGRAK